MKFLAWYIDLNGVNNKNTVKDPYPTDIIMVSTEDSTSPTLVLSPCTHAYEIMSRASPHRPLNMPSLMAGHDYVNAHVPSLFQISSMCSR